MKVNSLSTTTFEAWNSSWMVWNCCANSSSSESAESFLRLLFYGPCSYLSFCFASLFWALFNCKSSYDSPRSSSTFWENLAIRWMYRTQVVMTFSLFSKILLFKVGSNSTNWNSASTRLLMHFRVSFESIDSIGRLEKVPRMWSKPPISMNFYFQVCRSEIPSWLF